MEKKIQINMISCKNNDTKRNKNLASVEQSVSLWKKSPKESVKFRENKRVYHKNETQRKKNSNNKESGR